YMATRHESNEEHALISVKGAPEQILLMCSKQQRLKGTEPLTPDYWYEQAERLAQQGLRVLAVAQRYVNKNSKSLAPAELSRDLVLLGLVGLIDPPRAEAVTA